MTDQKQTIMLQDHQNTPFTAWVDDALHHTHRMSNDEAYRQEVALRINPLASSTKLGEPHERSIE